MNKVKMNMYIDADGRLKLYYMHSDYDSPEVRRENSLKRKRHAEIAKKN